MGINIYPENELAQTIADNVMSINFGQDLSIVPVTSQEIARQIEDSEIGGIDYRAKTKPEDGYGTVFEGLAFDPNKVRSQSFALYEKESPVGVMTVVVAPKSWIEKQRYFKKEENGVSIVDASSVVGELPDYFIIPAWTKVIASHRLKFALKGFNAFKKIMERVQEFAPSSTWMVAIAKGQSKNRDELIELSKGELNSTIPIEDLPFKLEMIGKSNPDSTSSEKMARLMGLKTAKGLGSNRHLGPIFAKKVK